MRRTIVLAAGGTGGHLYPAQALCETLTEEGHRVFLLTDQRGMRWSEGARCWERVLISSAPLRSLKGGFSLIKGIWESFSFLKTQAPSCVVGFGGYPSVPPLLAARLLKIPVFLHEQNAVMGQANRLCSRWALKIATSVDKMPGVSPSIRKKMVLTGNPLRTQIVHKRPKAPRCFLEGGLFHLFIFGGSQGARFFSELVPNAVALLPQDLRARLRIVQQCRMEDHESLKAAYHALGVKALLAPFFEAIEDHLLRADLVLSRSGASSVGEVCALRCASFLVPLPGGRDQKSNAALLEAFGGCLSCDQDHLTPERFASVLKDLSDSPGRLHEISEKASQRAVFEAPERLKRLILDHLP